MSERTIKLIGEIRSHNVEFAYISGARKSTLLQRLPTLARADLAIGETGGRIYDKCSAGDCRSCVRGAVEELDPAWTRAIEKFTGPIEAGCERYAHEAGHTDWRALQLPPPEEREGVLWDWYRDLLAAGIRADTRAYTCGFRVDLKKQKQPVDAAYGIMQTTILSRMPDSLACAQNLGKYDFFPAISGKGNACKHVLSKRGFERGQAVALFDDDNDLPMAEECDHCYVMQCTHGKVAEAVSTHPEWVVATEHGPLAAEEVLEAILKGLVAGTGAGAGKDAMSTTE
jgi:hydroxymethylpyrimidine pyrophosphatase-like HAD family hydrolase